MTVSFHQAYVDKTGQRWASGSLYSKIRAAVVRGGRDGRKGSMDDWTVLANSADPYRKDTWNGTNPGIQHVNGRWLADQIAELGLTGTIHQRGLHYNLISKQVTRPKGAGGRSSKVNYVPYVNDEETWVWLQDACSSARWLGYVSFDSIHDARNASPVVIDSRDFNVDSAVHADLGWALPDRRPTFDLPNFGTMQPYQLAIVGEKSSLAEMVAPIARQYGADVYLPNGHMSTTHCYQMAQRAWLEDRTLVVAYLADCDPWGYFMPIAVARKLQAFADAEHIMPGLRWQVHRVGLTPEQVREHGLPSAPLAKGTDKQRARWEAETGTGQTELDAALSLAPDLLPRLIREKLDAFFDHDLARRNNYIRDEWIAEANVRFDDIEISPRRAAALDRLDEIDRELSYLVADLGDYVVDLPDKPQPADAVVFGDGDELASDGPFIEVTTRLREDKLRFGVVDGMGDGE